MHSDENELEPQSDDQGPLLHGAVDECDINSEVEEYEETEEFDDKYYEDSDVPSDEERDVEEQLHQFAIHSRSGRVIVRLDL